MAVSGVWLVVGHDLRAVLARAGSAPVGAQLIASLEVFEERHACHAVDSQLNGSRPYGAVLWIDERHVGPIPTGRKQGGAYFSIWLMTRKLAYALGLFIGTGAAVWVGFDSLADPQVNPNSAFSLLMLACLYSVVPAIFKFVAMPLLWHYPLTEKRVSEIQAQIEAKWTDQGVKS